MEKAVIMGDIDKNLSAETRSSLIALIESSLALIASGHFPNSGFGEIIKVDSKCFYRPIP
ncbi:MAG TPA: hypothetical protein EYN92_05580 [Dehalococcoidia bacterium]|nr:hypothetical protein [Dehalococcoidia bacterium]